MTARRGACRRIIEVTPDLAHTYFPLPHRPTDIAEYEVWIRRAGARCKDPCKPGLPWLLRYPAHDDVENFLGFRWDNELHELPPALYYAELRCGDTVCDRFWMRVKPCALPGSFTKSLTTNEVT